MCGTGSCTEAQEHSQSLQGSPKIRLLSDLSTQELMDVYEDIFREMLDNEALISAQFRAAVSRRDAAHQRVAAALKDAKQAESGWAWADALDVQEITQAEMKVQVAKQEAAKAEDGLSHIVLWLAETWFEAFARVLSEIRAEEAAEEAAADINSCEADGAAMAVHEVLLASSLALNTTNA